MGSPGVIDLSGARNSGLRLSIDRVSMDPGESRPTDTSPVEASLAQPRFSLSLLNTIEEEPTRELVPIISQASQHGH
jgi:hypothetical protein